jgi:hypothetical protein
MKGGFTPDEGDRSRSNPRIAALTHERVDAGPEMSIFGARFRRSRCDEI